MKASDKLFLEVLDNRIEVLDDTKTIAWIKCFIARIAKKGIIIKALNPRICLKRIARESNESSNAIGCDLKIRGYEIQLALCDTSLCIFKEAE